MKMLRSRLLQFGEGTLWALGLTGLVAWGAVQIGAGIDTRHALQQFAARRSSAGTAGMPDQSLWSPERIAAWRTASGAPASAPLAVLRIPKIRLEVPILPGTDERTLDRAVGHIDETAVPGADGNSGIAGHRDGFFRGLKDVTPGDAIELDTLDGKLTYRVERTWVVEPEDVSVLDPTPSRALTLVTCYPFYYVGPAPQRFIVRAEQVPAPNRAAAPVSCPLCALWKSGTVFGFSLVS
jgi:sortase A